ncbi:uncharacterized protein LOC105168421 isoform X2 [Sesamum indicum]|uniref:Uncharacterized protein LOC105168421 isoform X2 n=1 Tax=Sesamum indicum TaxID=4182 RepID=A0A8M8V500_SESIN|nr:uncharacterized protein LOC105168421 isoform X2 [Sesamum indicum]
MACRSVMRVVFLTEPWLPLPFMSKKCSSFTPIISPHKKTSTPYPNCGCRIAVNAKSYHFSRNCSNSVNPSSSGDDSEQGPPQEAVLKAISVSKTEGRVGQTTNVVIGGTVADDSANEWLALDQKVNTYPTVRGFTAIGTGGDDFVQAMVVAVESVLQQPIPEFCPFPWVAFFQKKGISKKNLSCLEGQVKQKISSGGKYVSVNIGPVQVVSSEQVQAVYNAMRRDDRMKYFL